jgi:hypothetical protein
MGTETGGGGGDRRLSPFPRFLEKSKIKNNNTEENCSFLNVFFYLE